MKKFQFSLNKLSNYKEQVLKREKNELASLRNQQQVHINEKLKLINYLENTNEQFNKAKDFTSQSMAIHKYFCTSLSEQIKQQINLIAQVQKKIDSQLSVVLEATRDVNTLDNLHDKQLAEYKKAEQKENELFIEEFVSSQSLRQQ